MKTNLILGSLLALSGAAFSQNNYIPGLSPSAGNIGINLPSAPIEYNLQVKGSIGMQYGSIFGVTNTGWPAAQTKIFLTGWDATNSDFLAFFTPGTAGTSNTLEKMRITNSGKVGIGTPNPLTKLYVEETDASSGGAGFFEMTVSTGNQVTGIRGFGNGSTVSNQGGIFSATGSGHNIGVWSVVQGNPGDWAGYFTGDVNIVGKAYCTLNLWSSDRKLKKEIKPLNNSISKIVQLRPSSYLFRTDEFKSSNLPDGLQLGLVAQELEEIFPELVSEIADQPVLDSKGKISGKISGHKVVNYVGLIPVLIGGMQEQQQIIEKQSTINTELQKQLNEQKQLINDLQQKIGTTTGIGQNSLGSDGFSMEQNIPNPFSNETIIKYTMPQSVNSAYMAVYDLSGKQITTLPITKGTSSLSINSEKLAAGIYIYSIVADGKIMDSKRMVVSGK